VTFVETQHQPVRSEPGRDALRAKIPFRLSNAANPLYRLANEQINTERSRYTGNAKATYRCSTGSRSRAATTTIRKASLYSDEVPKNFLDAAGRNHDREPLQAGHQRPTFNTGATLTSVRSFRLGS